MLHDDRIAKDRGVRGKVVLAKTTQQEPPGLQRWSRGQQREAHSYLLPRVRPPKRLLKRATWPRSCTCRVPPTRAGWTFRSMSRCSVSPSLPQVERVWNLVPSVISTLIM